jgi:ABC-type lipoprotein export system ATPase subunit
MTDQQPLIELEAISKTYRPPNRPPVRALKDVSLTVRKGEFVAVVGASGSGKSTLLNLLGLLDRPSSGRYRFGDNDVSSASLDEQARLRNRRIGFVFQAYRLLPRSSALENVELPLLYSDAPVQNDVAKRMLELVGLGDRIQHRATELSGGQQQRVAIARALINSPDLLLADEPTGNLDPATALEIAALFGQLNAQGKTILWVTHDHALAKHCRRVITIADGTITQDTGARASTFESSNSSRQESSNARAAEAR